MPLLLLLWKCTEIAILASLMPLASFMLRKAKQESKFFLSFAFFLTSLWLLPNLRHEFTPNPNWIGLLGVLGILYSQNSTIQSFSHLELARCCIFSPLTEEFIYRKMILTKLMKIYSPRNDFFSISSLLVSALIFAFAHLMQPIPNEENHLQMKKMLKEGNHLQMKENALKLGYTFVFGLVAGFLWLWDSQRLICPVSCHLICNLFGFPKALQPSFKKAISVKETAN